MDLPTLKEQAERCRRLAKHADPFTQKRLLDLDSEYEAQIAKLVSPSLPPHRAFCAPARTSEWLSTCKGAGLASKLHKIETGHELVFGVGFIRSVIRANPLQLRSVCCY